MRQFMLLSALLLVPVAHAQDRLPAEAPRDAAPMSVVQVTPDAGTFRLRNAQVERIGGVYEMSNGWSIDVRADTRSIDAIVDGQRHIRLVPVSANKFVSGDGNVTMLFNQGDAGDGLIVSYVPDVRLSQVVVISSMPGQR